MTPAVRKLIKIGVKRSFTFKERAALAEEALDKQQIDVNVYFDFGSYELRPESKRVVNIIGDALKNDALAPYTFVIEGHTDAKGSREINQSLSDSRASSVRSYLIEKFGISETQLVAVGFGMTRLKNRNDPFADENRRVNIVLMGR